MQELIDFILAGQTDFTPEALIRLFFLMLFLESITRLAGSFIALGRK